MKKFNFKLNTLFWVLTICALMLFLTVLLFNLFTVLGLFSLISYNLVSEIVMLVFSLLFICYLVSNIYVRYYKIDSNYLTLQLSLFKNKILLSSVKLVQEDKVTRSLILYYEVLVKTELKIKPISVNIKSSDNQEFLTCLRQNCPSIRYELFDKESVVNGGDSN